MTPRGAAAMAALWCTRPLSTHCRKAPTQAICEPRVTSHHTQKRWRGKDTVKAWGTRAHPPPSPTPVRTRHTNQLPIIRRVGVVPDLTRSVQRRESGARPDTLQMPRLPSEQRGENPLGGTHRVQRGGGGTAQLGHHKNI